VPPVNTPRTFRAYLLLDGSRMPHLVASEGEFRVWPSSAVRPFGRGCIFDDSLRGSGLTVQFAEFILDVYILYGEDGGAAGFKI